MAVQASSYGEEDIDPEGSDAVMSDKVTYTFDELVDQVQVESLCSACLNKQQSPISAVQGDIHSVCRHDHAQAADCHHFFTL